MILDATLEELSLIRDLRALHPGTRVLLIGPRADPAIACNCFRAGAAGYVTLREEPGELLEAMRQVSQGHVFASREVSESMIQEVAGGRMRRTADKVDKLSMRELEIFRMVGEGDGMTVIAQDLGISVKTAETHCRRIKEKLGLADAGALHECALRWVRRHPEVEGRMLREDFATLAHGNGTPGGAAGPDEALIFEPTLLEAK